MKLGDYEADISSLMIAGHCLVVDVSYASDTIATRKRGFGNRPLRDLDLRID